jgi:hypothetical protein
MPCSHASRSGEIVVELLVSAKTIYLSPLVLDEDDMSQYYVDQCVIIHAYLHVFDLTIEQTKLAIYISWTHLDDCADDVAKSKIHNI